MLPPVRPIPHLRPSENLRAAVTRSVCGVWLAALVLAPAAGSDTSAPFAIRSHEIQGLIHQVWTMRVSACEHAASDLLVLSTVGGPPTQQKRMTWMPCGAALTPGDLSIVERALPDETVVVDIARMPGRSGPQLFLVSASGIRIESLDGTDPSREIEIPGGLPRPYRPWEISRIPLVDAWTDLGPPVALVPALRGAWLVVWRNAVDSRAKRSRFGDVERG